ncbi:hypothetical protein R83H12_02317 [Fibrobacteria bacterium R8-3-H12]
MDTTKEAKDMVDSLPQPYKETEMPERELEYLRNDIGQHAKSFSEHTYKLLERIIFMWGGALTLFCTKDIFDIFDISNIFIFFIIITIFFISVIILYIFERKKLENLKAIAMLGSYIAIFYEKKPNNIRDGKTFWELTNFEKDKKERKKSDIVFKGEGFVLSVIASAIEILLLVIFYNKNFGNMDILGNVMLGICVLYALCSICLSREIFKISFRQSNWLKIKIRYLKFYMNYAIKNKHYSKEEAKNRFGEDFYNEIMQ